MGFCSCRPSTSQDFVFLGSGGILVSDCAQLAGHDRDALLIAPLRGRAGDAGLLHTTACALLFQLPRRIG